jgi:Ni,Fe-hydrogenase maturation factor
MSRFDLTTSDGLVKFQETLNAVINNKIQESKLNEAYKGFNSLSLGCLNALFESISDKLYETKKGKNLIKEYINSIKKNSSLQSKYTLFESVKNCSNDISHPELFLSEASKLKGHLKEAKIATVANILKECFSEVKINADEIKAVIDAYNKSVCPSIDYILENKCTPKNIVEYHSNMSKVLEYIKENVQYSTELKEIRPVKDVMNDIKNSLSEETEKYISNVLNDIYYSGKNIEELFETYKTRCIDILSESVKNGSIEEANRLSALKERLSTKDYNKETVNEDLLRLSELIETLSK